MARRLGALLVRQAAAREGLPAGRLCAVFQAALLLGVVWFTFWNGLWGGFPRADQLIYLHKIGQYHSFWDIIAASPSWNRIGVGDALLYRPLLFLQLGLFYYLFRYDAFLWQLASLLIHSVAVLGLYALLRTGSLKRTLYPFLIAALFGCSYLSAELVLWSHISGYLSFSAFAVLAILCLIRSEVSGSRALAWLGVLLVGLSEFCYELGAVLSFLLCALFLWRLLCGRRRRPAGTSSIDATLCLAFFALTLLYPLLSIADLYLRGVHGAASAGGPPMPWALVLAAWYALLQIAFWLGALMVPFAYDVQALSRASFTGFHFSGVAFFCNLILAVGLVALLAGLAYRSRSRLVAVAKSPILLGLYSLVYLGLYSFVIAFGRAVPRGISHVLGGNIYYTYIAGLIIAVGIALAFLDGSGVSRTLAGRARAGAFHGTDRLLAAGRMASYGLLAILVLCNAYKTQSLATFYRYGYSAPRLALADAVEHWLRGAGRHPDAYFRIADDCAANQSLPWFGQFYFREGHGWSGPAFAIDVLWPEKSFRLNKAALQGKSYRVYDIGCARITASSQIDGLGPGGILLARSPAWHARLPVGYPQSLDVDFGRVRTIGRILFLPQLGLPGRAPRSIVIEVRLEDGSWHDVYRGDLACWRPSEQWRTVALPGPATARYLRVGMFSNCGDEHYLTLRGLSFR